jgi:hypothetical protein
MICPRLLLGALVEWFRHMVKKIDTQLPDTSYRHYHHHDQ